MDGYNALRESAAWIDLSARGKIRVTGEDRARLLHAMSTNSVNDLAAGAGIYLFFLNEKGRILGDAYLYNFGDDMLLDTEPETASKLREHLDRFIIADDVTLEDETENWACIGLEGPKSIEAATRMGLAVPAEQICGAELGQRFRLARCELRDRRTENFYTGVRKRHTHATPRGSRNSQRQRRRSTYRSHRERHAALRRGDQ